MFEDVARQGAPRRGPLRTFGVSLGILWSLVSIAALATARLPLAWTALAIAVALLLVAIVRPALLGPVQGAWIRLGLLLARVVNPVVLALLFVGVLCPFAWLRRLRTRDPLGLERDAAATSYWRPCASTQPTAESMRHVF